MTAPDYLEIGSPRIQRALARLRQKLDRSNRNGCTAWAREGAELAFIKQNVTYGDWIEVLSVEIGLSWKAVLMNLCHPFPGLLHLLHIKTRFLRRTDQDMLPRHNAPGFLDNVLCTFHGNYH